MHEGYFTSSGGEECSWRRDEQIIEAFCLVLPREGEPGSTVSLREHQTPELAEEYGVGVGTIWRALQPACTIEVV